MSLSPEQCEDFWALADKDGSGCLSIQELYEAVRVYKPDTTEKESVAMFVGIDGDGNKMVTKDEFFAEMAQKPARAEGLLTLFRDSDKSGDGVLSKDEVTEMIKTCFKPEVVDKVIKKIFEVCDNGDGKISYDEFKKFFEG